MQFIITIDTSARRRPLFWGPRLLPTHSPKRTVPAGLYVNCFNQKCFQVGEGVEKITPFKVFFKLKWRDLEKGAPHHVGCRAAPIAGALG